MCDSQLIIAACGEETDKYSEVAVRTKAYESLRAQTLGPSHRFLLSDERSPQGESKVQPADRHWAVAAIITELRAAIGVAGFCNHMTDGVKYTCYFHNPASKHSSHLIELNTNRNSHRPHVSN